MLLQFFIPCMVIATIPAKYAALQTARTLSIFVSSILNLTLHFCSGAFLSYKLHYTRFPGRINYFAQSAISPFVHSIQFVYRFVNCKAYFLQFILHFCACIVSPSVLQECPAKTKNAVHSASFQSPSSKRVAALAARRAIFPPFPSFFGGRNLKKRRTLFKSARRLVKIP